MRKSPPPHGALSASTIVDAALELADREGLDAVSMRRLAGEMDVTPMALYYYVQGKEELVDLMADEALAQLPEVDAQGSWETELERHFLGIYRLMVRHPALAEVMTHRPLEGPGAVRVGERLLALLAGADLDDDAVVAAFVMLFNYTIGAGLYRLSRDRPQEHRLANVTREIAPISHRLRERLATAGAEQHFVDGLRRIIQTYRQTG